MKIPEKIKIGEHDYDIKKVPIVDWKNSNIIGQINYGKKEIKLKMFKTDERVDQDTFFHEIAHGILKELEFNHPQITKFRNEELFAQEMGLLLRKSFLDLMKKQDLNIIDEELIEIEKWLELARTNVSACRCDGYHSNFSCPNCNIYFALNQLKRVMGKSDKVIKKEFEELSKKPKIKLIYDLMNKEQKQAVDAIQEDAITK